MDRKTKSELLKYRIAGVRHDAIAAQLGVDADDIRLHIDEREVEIERLQSLIQQHYLAARSGDKDAAKLIIEIGREIARLKAEPVSHIRIDDFGAGDFESLPWRELYNTVRQKFPASQWRKAAYIAWQAAPFHARVFRTQKDFAEFVGIDASTIRKWISADEKRAKVIRAKGLVANPPLIREEIESNKLNWLSTDIDEIISAGIQSAKQPGRDGFNDRKLILEHVLSSIGNGNKSTAGSLDEWQAKQRATIESVDETIALFDEIENDTDGEM